MKKDVMGKKGKGCLVIIGSGPVGMVSALMLKAHFEKVILLERQSQEKFLQKHGLTFPIVFTPASIRILEGIGVWKPLMQEKSEYYGVIIHKRIMGKELEFTVAKEGVYSHWRNHIIAKLYQRILDEELQIHFDTNVEDIDFPNNFCKEQRLGNISFELLLGADGMHSFTRRLMAKAHPKFTENEFSIQLLHKWHAYRLPSKGLLREKFGGGNRHLASHIYLDNLSRYPADKFRLISTSMRRPNEEINILIRHDAQLDSRRVKALNAEFFEPYVDSVQNLNEKWGAGCSGMFEHVQTPTFHLNSVLLVGDAAHGFESSGDLINLGITSVGSFCDILNKSRSIPEALQQYDETVGDSLRFYASYALRRAKGKTTGEMVRFVIARKLGIVRGHPTLYSNFEEDFEIQNSMARYKRDLLKVNLLFYGIPSILLSLVGLIFLT